MTNKDSQAFQEENRIGCFIVILEIITGVFIFNCWKHINP